MRRPPRQTPRHRTSLLVGLLGLGLMGLVALGCENRVGAPRCGSASDCQTGETCVDGYCAASDAVPCIFDTECGPGGLCRDGFCAPPLDPNLGEGDGGSGNPTWSGTVEVTPREVDFGSPALGVGVEQPLRVVNAGGGTFEVVGLSREAGTSEEFTWRTEQPLPIALSPGDQLEITLVYTLADGQDDVGRLFLETTATACAPACDDPAAIPVDVVSEFKGSRNLRVTPPEHDFGYVPPGSESGPRSVLITNEGSIDKVLTVSSLDVSGDLAEFTYTLPPLPLYLAPGQSAEIPVVYAPTAAAPGHELTFVATANSDSPERTTGTAHFTASSQPPNALVFEPPELVFPNLVVGQTAQRESTLKNIGGVPIQVTSLVLGQQIPQQYSVATAVQLPYTLLPNASIDVYVDFQAQSGGAALNQVQALNNQAPLPGNAHVPVLSLRGESYVPPGGPNVSVSMGPEGGGGTGCMFFPSSPLPAANVDIRYRAPSGAICGKPADVSCGMNGGSCPCTNLSPYGDVRWSVSRQETVNGEIWLIDEQVTHTGTGQDGQFQVSADLLDNCIAGTPPASWQQAYNLCMFDCDFDGPQECFDYYRFPYCAAACQYYASEVARGCLIRGPIPVKTEVRIWGGATDETRYFCKTLGEVDQPSSADIVTLNRQSGYFTIGSIAPGVVEVSAHQPCP